MSATDELLAALDERPRKRTDVATLLAGWSITTPTPDDLQLVADELVQAGISVDPPLESIEDLGQVVVLRREEPEVLRRRARIRETAIAEGGGDRRPGGTGGARGAHGRAPADDPHREPLQAPLLAAGAGLVLLGLFLPWFSGARGGIEVDELGSGWEWLGILDIYLLLTVIATLGLLVLTASQATGTYHRFARGVLVAAAAAIVAVIFRIVSPPEDAVSGFILEIDRGIGGYVTVLGCAAIAFGAMSSSVSAAGLAAQPSTKPEPA